MVRLAWRAAERWFLGGWAGKRFFAQNRRFGRANRLFRGCFRVTLGNGLKRLRENGTDEHGTKNRQFSCDRTVISRSYKVREPEPEPAAPSERGTKKRPFFGPCYVIFPKTWGLGKISNQ